MPLFVFQEVPMFALIILLALVPAETWSMRTARMEGAAGNVREAAGALATTAEEIASGGRVRDVALLRSQASTLHQRVLSAGLAASLLDQPEPGAAPSPEGGPTR